MERWPRRILITLATLGAIAAMIDRLAAWDVRREREQRRALGDRLYAEVRGEGAPVVFLSGFEGSTRYWRGAFDPLVSDRRLIFLDALGFGRSPWPDVEYSLDDHLGAIERTLQALDAREHVTLVGHSFGAILAAYYAERHPSEIDRLVLLGTPVFGSPKEARDRIAALSQLSSVFSLNRPLAAVSCAVVCAFRPTFRRLAPLIARDLPPEVAEDALLHDWQSFDGTLRNVILTKPVAEPLSTVGKKTVLVHGERDRVTPLARVRALAERSGAELVVVPGDHHHYLDEADQLREWIVGSPSTSAGVDDRP